MASPPNAPRRSEDLIAELALTRDEIAAHRLGLRRAAHFSDRVQRSFHEHTGLFFGSAVALGLAISLIPSFRGKSREEKAYVRARKSADRAREAVSDSQTKTQTRSLLAILGTMAAKAAFEAAKPMVLRIVRDHYLNAHRAQAAAPARPRAPEPTV